VLDADPHVRGHAFFAIGNLDPRGGIASVTSALGAAGATRRLEEARAALDVAGSLPPPASRDLLCERLRRLLARPVSAPRITAAPDVYARIEKALAVLREKAPGFWYLVAATVDEVRAGEGPAFLTPSTGLVTLSRADLGTAAPEAVAGDLVHAAAHLYLRTLGQRWSGHVGEESALVVEARALAQLCGAGTQDLAVEDDHVLRVLRTRFWLAAEKEERPW
jgi:hypothetical protein